MIELDSENEWKFLQNEIINYSVLKIPYIYRELLFCSEIILCKYLDETDLERNRFLKNVYIETKEKYLQLTSKLRKNIKD